MYMVFLFDVSEWPRERLTCLESYIGRMYNNQLLSVRCPKECLGDYKELLFIPHTQEPIEIMDLHR